MVDFFKKRKYILGPMAGVSDVAFRQICLECGADLTYTEMVSSKALSFENKRTNNLLHLAPNENKVVVQLFGHEPNVMAHEAFELQKKMGERIAFLDINMGCPARKIVSKGDGCSLMENETLACEIVAAVKNAIDLPVGVKFRRGWKINNDHSLDFGKQMVNAGADILTLHGRFGQQFYNGSADWECIAMLKAAVNVPVIGNGDVSSALDAEEIIRLTNCDAVMVARAARGNPWIFSDIKNGKDVERSAEEKLKMAIYQAQLMYKNNLHIIRMRKHACYYLTGLPGAAKARELINKCSTLDEFEDVLIKGKYGLRTL